jgi:hypothetical protein
MSIDLEYAIKTDIRNNPVVRETDLRHGQELRRTLLLGVLTVAMLLFSVWQRSNMTVAGYHRNELRIALERESVANRQLRVNLEALQALSPLEARAMALGLRRPTLTETLILERAHDSAPPGAIVALAR